MSSPVSSRQKYQSLDFNDLIEAVGNGGGALSPKPGRRARKRNAKQKLSQVSMLAPLLATEGCLTVGGKGQGPVSENAGGKGNGASAPAADTTSEPTVDAVVAEDDTNFHTGTNNDIMIAASDLTANDALPEGATAEVIRVFGASHGTVMLHDGVVHFTPEENYEGMASFSYEVRDSLGNLSEANVDIHVGPMDGMTDGAANDGGMTDGHVHTTETPHPDDEMKTAEHMAAMNLVPVSEATHIAVNNGSWFDPNTWAGGEVPGEGANVVIPDGIEVTYDGESPVSIFTIRVDGGLSFSPDVDTFLEVDTMVVTMTGRLSMGSMEHPVDPNVHTIIQIADNGPINVDWDPFLLSRGIISHGEVQIHGAEKETFLKVSVDPMAGDTSLTLDGLPEGWQVGDRLVLTGTHLTPTEQLPVGTPRDDETQDEELIITAIDGNTIYFDTPLQFDHDAPREDLKAYVANYSRNIQIYTENADELPVFQRGHVMFMHTDNLDVRYAEFTDLGRTDKSLRAVEAGDLETPTYDANVKGRYALHIHRAGLSDPDDPAIVVGNAVWGSPGWGYVHHDSNAILTDNAAYDVYGAAFVAESGNEIGRWSHNIAIKSIGVAGGPKYHEDVAAFDLGRNGVGFYFQGRLVDAIDNVAAGMPGGFGYVYMSRGNQAIDVTSKLADQHEALRYESESLINRPAISQFEQNEAFAVRIGLEVIKAGSVQHHDVRSVIDGFTAWEVSYGVQQQYTGHYTLMNLDIIGTDGSAGGHLGTAAILFGPNTIDMVINGAVIEGFDYGISPSREIINMNYPFDNDWRYVFIDVETIGAIALNKNPDATDLILSGEDLPNLPLTFDSDLADFVTTPTPESRESLTFSGTKTDSLGEAEVSMVWDPIEFNYFNLLGALKDEGYWTLPDGRKVIIVDQYFADRATGELDKVGILVEWTRSVTGYAEGDPVYNGELDINSLAPVGRTDFATVQENQSVTIDVLSNDYDPEGDTLAVDGTVQASYGSVYVNDDNTITYVPDPNFTGTDEFWYWVEDSNGNFDKAMVQVTVEV